MSPQGLIAAIYIFNGVRPLFATTKQALYAKIVLYVHVIHLIIRLTKNVYVMLVISPTIIDSYVFACLYLGSLSGKLLMRNVHVKLEAIESRPIFKANQKADIARFDTLLSLAYVLSVLAILASNIVILATQRIGDFLVTMYGHELNLEDIQFYHYFGYVDYVLMVFSGYVWLPFVAMSFLIRLKKLHMVKMTQLLTVVDMIKKPNVSSARNTARCDWNICLISEKQVIQTYAPCFVAYTFWLFLFYTLLVISWRSGIGGFEDPKLWLVLSNLAFPVFHTVFLILIIVVNYKFHSKLSQLIDHLVLKSEERLVATGSEDASSLVSDVTKDWKTDIKVYSLYSINFGFVLDFVASIIPLAIIILDIWREKNQGKGF
ncbi:hypothetical protein HDE_05905 [Halotydeus destructor]|nr:hypothetical protein HDE_05905 [Halotydeus destructor]